MAITDWPENERPREKLLTNGANTLSDAELLAIFLRTGIRGKTAVDLARDVLKAFGSIRLLLTANQQQFCQQHGLGLAKYSQLQACLELSKRHLSEILQRDSVLASPQHTKQFLVAKLRDYPHEVFACLFLDSHYRVICFEELFRGSIHSANVHPREVIKQALYYNAAAIIFAHNHPSGIAQPSNADIKITQKLSQALKLIDIKVLDHLIIGDGDICSLAERGIL